MLLTDALRGIPANRCRHHPLRFEQFLNELLVPRGLLPDHPPDVRGSVRFRRAACAESMGGLTVYDHGCGRLPIGPTLAIEWGQL